MINIDGKKVSQQEVDLMLIVACKRADLNTVIKCVEEYGANVNAMDAANYARVLIYALRACDNGKGSKGETIVKYLVNRGAEINFKHGDKGSLTESRPYFIYWAAENTNFISDDLVEFLVRKGGAAALDYVPNSKTQNYKSAGEIIKTRRPELYKNLVKNKVITSGVKR